MKLGIVIPLWGRESLARLTLRRCARATAGDSGCVRVAVTDEVKNGAQARNYGFEVVSAPNIPLSDKKNAGVKHLQGRVDAVIFLGSDDWGTTLSTTSFLDQYRKKLQVYPCLGPLDLWYMNLDTGRAGYSAGYTGDRKGEPIGVGRAIRSDALDALDWLPRPSGLHKNHDGGMRKKLAEAGYRFQGFVQKELGIHLVDIKSKESITPYRRLTLRATPWTEALGPFPKQEVQELLSQVTPVVRIAPPTTRPPVRTTSGHRRVSSTRTVKPHRR